MVIHRQLAQGQVWWASLGEPIGSAPGYRRPVVVVQGDRFNRSRIATAVVVPITRTLRLADQPGNVLLHAVDSGLPSDSVANVSHAAFMWSFAALGTPVWIHYVPTS